MKSITRLSSILVLIVLLMAVAQPVAAMTGDEADDLRQTLQDLGYRGVSVVPYDDWAYISFAMRSDALGEWDDVLEALAGIAVISAESTRDDFTTAKIVMNFEDGNQLVFAINPDDAQDYLDDKLSSVAFEALMEVSSANRGPILVPGTCDVDAGDSCATSDACPCYANERCEPGHDDANPRGCVVESVPDHASLVAGQYACDLDYIWDDTGENCIRATTCDTGEIAIEGECQTAEQPQTSAPGLSDPWDGLGINLVWVIMAGMVCLFVPVVIVIIILIVRRRKRTTRQPASVQGPSAAQAPAPLPPHFAELERQYAQLTAAYQAGQITPAAYQNQAQQLVTRDQRGHWAFSTGQWRWFDGTAWRPRDPRR